MTPRQPPWLTQARKHLGFHEGPNNDTPFGKHYGLNHEPWCAMFVSFCCEKSGHPLPVMQAGMRNGYAGVFLGMEWAKAHGYWRPSWEADPGDAIVYGWDGPNSPSTAMHTGFIVSAGPKGTVGHTIEGNRGDQVEKQTFIVGAPTVLGTIALTKVLADHKAGKIPKPIPVPQPRHPAHPTNTGPTSVPKPPVVHVPAAKPLRFGPIRALVVDGITADLRAGQVPGSKAAKALDDLRRGIHQSDVAAGK